MPPSTVALLPGNRAYNLVIWQILTGVLLAAIWAAVSLETVPAVIAAGLAVVLPNLWFAWALPQAVSSRRLLFRIVLRFVFMGLCVGVGVRWFMTDPIAYFVTLATVLLVPVVAGFGIKAT